MKKQLETWGIPIAVAIIGVIGQIVKDGRLWGKPINSPSWSFALYFLFAAGCMAGGIWWGKRIECEKQKAEREKHKTEISRLKSKAIVVSILQPKGITFFSNPAVRKATLYLYVRTATPLESKYPQAEFHIGRYHVVLKSERLHQIPVSNEGTKGYCIPLEKVLTETETEIEKELQKLAQNCKAVEHITISPNLSDDSIPMCIDFTTFIEITL